MKAIDLIKIPFSTRGAYTVFSIMKAEEKSHLFIRDIRGGDLDPGCLFKFAFETTQNGDSSNANGSIDLSEIRFVVTPSLLTATYDDLSFMEIAFEDEEVFRIRTLSSVINVKLEAVAHKYNTIAQIGSAHWEFTSYFKEIKMGIHKCLGDGEIHADWSAIGNKVIEIQLGNVGEWRFATYLVSEGVHPFVQDDSGWDNGTFFSEGVPVITPDLTTFLLLQIQFLIDYAPDQSRADKWKKTYDTLMTNFIEKLWDGKAFNAIKWPEKRIIRMDGTLQRLLPLLLSKCLPDDIIVKLKRDLSEFETPFGFATEKINSPYYKYNGYWRGPIWAPTTLLMIDALKRTSEPLWADRIRDKYIQCIMTGGFAENFDPLTGEGLVDTGFAWTASVFTILACQSNE